MQGDINWQEACNLGLFLLLCVGCLAVWVGLVRAWVSCCKLERQVSTASASFRLARHHVQSSLCAWILLDAASHGANLHDTSVHKP